MPVETDLASATVISRRAIDAEGLSTTLLALGAERAAELAAEQDAAAKAILVGGDGCVTAAG